MKRFKNLFSSQLWQWRLASCSSKIPMGEKKKKIRLVKKKKNSSKWPTWKSPSPSPLKFTEDLVSSHCKNTTPYLRILCYWTGFNSIHSPSSSLNSKKWQYSRSATNVQNHLEGKAKTREGWEQELRASPSDLVNIRAQLLTSALTLAKLRISVSLFLRGLMGLVISTF